MTRSNRNQLVCEKREERINNDFPCACWLFSRHNPPSPMILKNTTITSILQQCDFSLSLHHTNMTSEPWTCWEDAGVSGCRCKETGWRTLAGWKMVACLGVRVNCMLITDDKVEKWVWDIIYPEQHINQGLTWGISLSSTTTQQVPEAQSICRQAHCKYVIRKKQQWISPGHIHLCLSAAVFAKNCKHNRHNPYYESQ